MIKKVELLGGPNDGETVYVSDGQKMLLFVKASGPPAIMTEEMTAPNIVTGLYKITDSTGEWLGYDE